jgi:hypothetical protein
MGRMESDLPDCVDENSMLRELTICPWIDIAMRLWFASHQHETFAHHRWQ